MKRFVVIGGGITGLAAAWRLKSRLDSAGEPYSLLLLEATSYSGTSIQSIRRDGFLLETGPDCFLSQKPRGVGLAQELGLESEMIGTRPEHRRSFILRDGRFHTVPEGFYLLGPSKLRPFLQSGLISWKGKWRALMEPLISRRRPSPGSATLSPRERDDHNRPPSPHGRGKGEGSDESLGSFVRRRLGSEMLDWLAQPLVAGIYGADPEDLSLRATFPLFQEMEEKYGSVLLGLKRRSKVQGPKSKISSLDLGPGTLDAIRSASGPRYSLFVSFKNGMQTLTDRLVERLGPTVVRRNAKVQSLQSTSNHEWSLRMTNGESFSADKVVCALPAYAAADLLAPWDPELADDIRPIRYAPAATLNLAFRADQMKKPLDGIGFVVPVREAKALMGGTLVENKFAGRVPAGYSLIRAFIGGSGGQRWLSMPDGALTQQVLSELQSLLGISGPPHFHVLERYAQALPQYALGHLDRVLRVEERTLRWKGLKLAGNWLRGVGIPDCIESGERAAEALLQGV